VVTSAREAIVSSLPMPSYCPRVAGIFHVRHGNPFAGTSRESRRCIAEEGNQEGCWVLRSSRPVGGTMTAVEEPAALPALPTLSDQVDRLVELGVHEIADLPEETLRAAVERWGGDRTDALVVIDPRLAPPSAITPLLRRKGKPGFVVEDM